jgi:predicted RNase H-like HicB family nuclease
VREPPRYPKHVFWSDEDAGFIAIARDLPGSSAFGETEAEALAELDLAIDVWIEAARGAGNAVPTPSRPTSPGLPSGKVLVRMPKGLHQRAALCAEREDVSLNQFIVVCVAEAVGERVTRRRSRASTSYIIRSAAILSNHRKGVAYKPNLYLF